MIVLVVCYPSCLPDVGIFMDFRQAEDELMKHGKFDSQGFHGKGMWYKKGHVSAYIFPIEAGRVVSL